MSLLVMKNDQEGFSASPPRAWAEVRLGDLLHNYGVVRKHHSSEIMAVLKAGAYGHGVVPIAQALESLPAAEAPKFFGVASVGEARQLSEAGLKTRIYLLGPSCDFEREEVVARGWTPCLSSLEEAEDFNRLAGERDGTLAVHVTVDTGMGRGGFLPENLLGAIKKIREMKNLYIEGIGSHLPCADEDDAFTRDQFDRFDELLDSISEESLSFYHLANSAGILNYKSRWANLCRPGLMLYGISPMPHFQDELKPVLSLKSRVTLVRSLPAGHGISYGREAVLEKETLVATVGIGYGDGYPRFPSKEKSDVLIGGVRCPILGRVTMDQIMVDVSHLPNCKNGDEVELFGENILASELATTAGTIPWHILTSITPRVERVYL